MTPVAPARLAAWAGSLVRTRSRGADRLGEAAHPAITRNGGLDVVRLAGALLVLVAHVAATTGAAYGPVTYLGTIGVAMFFALSGYLIPTVWSGRRDRSYFLQRWARILPAYWAAVVILALVSGVAVTPQLLAMAVVFDVTHFDTFMVVAWTLQVEVIFYALVPLLGLVPTRWLLIAAAASLALFLTATDPVWRASFVPRFWMFLPGLLLARWTPRPVSVLVVPVGLALLVLAAVTTTLPPAVAGSGLLVLYALSRTIRIPRVVAFGAAISYGIYLWHHELLLALRDAGLSPVAIAIAGVGLTAAAATLSWLLLEQPIIRRAARWRRRSRLDEAERSRSGLAHQRVPAAEKSPSR